MRKYQPHWEKLKRDGMLQLKISFSGDVTAQKVYSRIQKAMKKEKWADEAYKRNYPGAQLKFARFDIDDTTIGIKIVLLNTVTAITIETF